MRRLLILTVLFTIWTCAPMDVVFGYDDPDLDGMQSIPKETYVRFVQPITEYYFITNQYSWERIVKYHFPDKDPKRIEGFAMYLPKGKVPRNIIVLPMLIGKPLSGKEFMSTIGHEALHVIDFNLGWEFFKPDELEKTKSRKEKTK